MTSKVMPMTMTLEDDAYLRRSPKPIAAACIVEIDALRTALEARDETIRQLRDDQAAAVLAPDAQAAEAAQQIAQLTAERLKLSVLVGQLIECAAGFRKAGLAHGWKTSDIDSLLEEARQALHG
jgi:hypothetical protein